MEPTSNDMVASCPRKQQEPLIELNSRLTDYDSDASICAVQPHNDDDE